MAGPRTLVLDIETFPLNAYVWRLYGEQNIGLSQLIDPGGPVMVGAKWLNEKPVKILTTHDATSDEFATQTQALLDEADVVITWNGDRFDIPHLNTVIRDGGLSAPSPFRSVDLFKIVKYTFKAPSNKLDYWAQAMGIGQKIKHDGFGLWLRCMDGDRKAWTQMATYCRQDVRLTEDIYHELRGKGWLRGAGPHAAMFDGAPDGCPDCGSHQYQKRGVARTKVSKYHRYQCTECGTWFRGLRLAESRAETRAIR
jgi:hypothetical protein